MNKKIKFRLRERIWLTVLVTGLITTFTLALVTSKNSKDLLQKSVENNMLNVALAYGNYVESRGEMTYREYYGLLSDVTISGYESSYVYVVDKNGTMLYHPTQTKVGQSVENAAVKGLVEKIASGEKPDPDVITYEFKNVDKMAGYYVTDEYDIVIVTCDLSEITSSTNGLTGILVWLGFACIVLCFFLGTIASKAIARPYNLTVDGANRIAELDVSEDPGVMSLCGRTDESADISRALNGARLKLNEVVAALHQESQILKDDSFKIKDSAQNISSASADNSAVTEELSAGMNSIADTTEKIRDRVNDVSKQATELDNVANKSKVATEEILERAKGLGRESREATEKAEKMLEEMQVKVSEATKKAEAVTKITSLTDTISEIADQTSLLSLNASIEAARAGESGRGFAVVADEIGKLAQDSTSAVQDIVEIVGEIKSAVDDMTSALTSIGTFVNDLVKKEFGEFARVGEQYVDDATTFGNTMEGFINEVDTLKSNVEAITTAIGQINDTLRETNVGVGEIADRTCEMADATAGISEMIVEIDDRAESLLKTINRFKLG